MAIRSEKVWGVLIFCLSILAIASYFGLIISGMASLAVLFVSTLVVLLFFGFTAWIGYLMLRMKWPEE